MVVVSAIWVILILAISRRATFDGHIFDFSFFLIFGIIPVVVAWGFAWVRKGPPCPPE
jgi:hypothetical protein